MPVLLLARYNNNYFRADNLYYLSFNEYYNGDNIIGWRTVDIVEICRTACSRGG
jgi:hypothetical protein